MTPRERVRYTLQFKSTDRVPRDLWTLPYISLFRQNELDGFLANYPVDIRYAEPSLELQDAERNKLAGPGSYVDEWGSLWNVGEPGIIGEVKKPAISDWSRLEHFQLPWKTIQKRSIEYVNQQCRRYDKFILSAVCARPFERLQFLRGTENVFIDLAYDTAELRKLIEMVHEFYIKDVDFWTRTDVDGVFLMDDWGSNHSLLIDPQMWRSVFKPLYQEYCRMIHQAGKYVFFHSDGCIESIYPDMIEIGVDALNSQLFVMDIEKLALQYKGKITFWGEIDRQKILPFGSPDDVRGAVRRIRKALYDGNGGVIAQCEWGKDNPAENINAVFETWCESV